MKHLYFLILFFVSSFCLSSCDNEMTQAELFDLANSGSVMILNKYYFQLKLPNGEIIYFTGLDNDGDLENVTTDVSEIQENCARMTGTGFFVDEQGSILTNRHVAQPFIEEDQIKAGYRSLLHSISAYYDYLRQNMSDKFDELEESKSDCYYTDGYDIYQDSEKLNEIESQQRELSSAYQETVEIIENLIALNDPSALKISTVCELGIAYRGH